MSPLLAACFVIFSLVSVATTAPVENNSVSPVTETSDCHNENSDVYDQRQNGTENYRIHVNGVMVLVAPAETVLQAAQLGALQMGGETETSATTQQSQQSLKPKPKPPSLTAQTPHNGSSTESSVVHPKDIKDKNNLKLLNLLHMFRNMRHDSEGTHHHGNK